MKRAAQLVGRAAALATLLVLLQGELWESRAHMLGDLRQWWTNRSKPTDQTTEAD